MVSDGEAMRLDQFLVHRIQGCSRRRARQAIDSGAVLINGRSGRKGLAVRPGDIVQADMTGIIGTPAAQPDLALPVLLADDAVLAVDKPAGMPTIALRAADRDTVANFLLGQYPELAAVGGSPFEAGLAHRLDTPTSGVLIAARRPEAWRALRLQFCQRRVDKLYLAIVAGRVVHRGTVRDPIAHHAKQRRRMCICTARETARGAHARPARTDYRPLRRLTGGTLLAVRIPTGVRHQIRVHLAAIGHPVLGDQLYGDAACAGASPRLLLHAARLAFAHPGDRRRTIVRSPLPADFRSVLRGMEMPRRSSNQVP